MYYNNLYYMYVALRIPFIYNCIFDFVLVSTYAIIIRIW